MSRAGRTVGRTVVFVGPTLPAMEVARLLPDALVTGPVAVGDVLRWIRRPGVTRLAIIDGYFERMAAVWHKELLIALERGIAVWGAASMGALRAAELAPFGMRGIGSVYRAFARGELVADDEVAVAHLPADYGFAAVSTALVDLRYGIDQAPMLAARTKAALVQLARRRFYRERTWEQLILDARAAGLPRRPIDAFAAWPKPSCKAADARALLRQLARDRKRPPAIRVPRTWALRQLEDWLARQPP
jgi:hypothetical protein